MYRRLLVLLALLGGGSAALGIGLRALAQAASPPPAATPTQAPTPAQPAATAPAAATVPAAAAPPATAEEAPELRQSADNNISFPVDI